jgi:hypothetical protein
MLLSPLYLPHLLISYLTSFTIHYKFMTNWHNPIRVVADYSSFSLASQESGD